MGSGSSKGALNKFYQDNNADPYINNNISLSNYTELCNLFGASPSVTGAGEMPASAVGGYDNMQDYVNSIYSKSKEKLIRSITEDVFKSLNVKGVPNIKSMPIENVVKLLVKALPPNLTNPKKFKGPITNNKSIQRNVCIALASAINKHYNGVLIDVQGDEGAMCGKIAEVMHSLLMGLHTEFMTVAGDVMRVMNNMRIANDYLESAYKKQKEYVSKSSDATLKMRSKETDEIYQAIKSEYNRQSAILANLMNIIITPTGKELVQSLENNKDFVGTVRDLKSMLGTPAFGDKLSFLLSGISSVAHTAELVDKALKKIGMSVSEFKSAKSSNDLRTKVFKHITDQNPTSEKLDEMMAAAKIIYESSYINRDDIAKELNKSGRGEDEDSEEDTEVDTEMDVEGGADIDVSEIDAELPAYWRKKSLKRKIESKKKFRDVLLEDFHKQLKAQRQIIVESANGIAQHIGKDIPVDDNLKNFAYTFEQIETLDKENIHKALSGYPKDINSKEVKDKFLISYQMAIKAVEPLTKGPQGSLFKSVHNALSQMVKLIENFNDKIVKALTEIHIDTPAEISASLKKSTSEFYGSGDSGDEIFGVGHWVDFNKIKNELKYYIAIADIKTNLARSHDDLRSYTEDYEQILGEEAAWIIDRIKLQYNGYMKHLDSDVSSKSLDSNLPECSESVKQIKSTIASLPSDKQKDVKNNYMFLWKYQMNAKVNLIKVAQAIDMYLKSFTEGMTKDPDSLGSIVKMLNSIEFVAKWLNDKSGDQLASLFDFFPCAYDANTNKAMYLADGDNAIIEGNGTIKIPIDGMHYYEYVEQRWSNGTPTAQHTPGNNHKYLPGNPFLGRSVTDMTHDQCKGIFKLSEKVVKSMRALENILSTFATVGSKFGSIEPLANTFMNPGQISNALCDYVVASAFSTEFATGTNNKSAVYMSHIREKDVQVQDNTKAVTVVQNIPNYDSKSAEFRTEGSTNWSQNLAALQNSKSIAETIDTKNYHGYGIQTGVGNTGNQFTNIAMSAIPVECDKWKYYNPAHSGNEEKVRLDSAGWRDNFFDTDLLFQMVIKSIVAKIFTVVDAYRLFHRPVAEKNKKSYYSMNPLRTILGGDESYKFIQQVKVIPEAFELYYRLPLLAEWYRHHFGLYNKVAKGDADAWEITLVPNIDGVWSDFMNIIFDKASKVESGNYTESQCQQIILSINDIWKLYRSKYPKTTVRSILNAFVLEMNRAFGFLRNKDIVEYINNRRSNLTTNDDYDKKADGDFLNFDILNADGQFGARSAPSDKFSKVPDVVTSRKQKEISMNWLQQSIEVLRTRIDNEFLGSIDDPNKYNMFADSLKQYKYNMQSAKNSSEEYKIVLNMLQNSERATTVNINQMVMVHEAVATPLIVLFSVYKVLARFNAFCHGTSMKNMRSWNNENFSSVLSTTNTVYTSYLDKLKLLYPNIKDDFMCKLFALSLTGNNFNLSMYSGYLHANEKISTGNATAMMTEFKKYVKCTDDTHYKKIENLMTGVDIESGLTQVRSYISFVNEVSSAKGKEFEIGATVPTGKFANINHKNTKISSFYTTDELVNLVYILTAESAPANIVDSGNKIAATKLNSSKLMKDIISLLLDLNASKLISCNFSQHGTINIDMNTIENACKGLLQQVKENINSLRLELGSGKAKTTLEKYEDSKNIGSVRWLEENLVQKLFNNRDEYGLPLASMHLQETFRRLLKGGSTGKNLGDDDADYGSMDEAVRSLIYYSSVGHSLPYKMYATKLDEFPGNMIPLNRVPTSDMEKNVLSIAVKYPQTDGNLTSKVPIGTITQTSAGMQAKNAKDEADKADTLLKRVNNLWVTERNVYTHFTNPILIDIPNTEVSGTTLNAHQGTTANERHIYLFNDHFTRVNSVVTSRYSTTELLEIKNLIELGAINEKKLFESNVINLLNNYKLHESKISDDDVKLAIKIVIKDTYKFDNTNNKWFYNANMMNINDQITELKNGNDPVLTNNDITTSAPIPGVKNINLIINDTLASNLLSNELYNAYIMYFMAIVNATTPSLPSSSEVYKLLNPVLLQDQINVLNSLLPIPMILHESPDTINTFNLTESGKYKSLMQVFNKLLYMYLYTCVDGNSDKFYAPLIELFATTSGSYEIMQGKAFPNIAHIQVKQSNGSQKLYDYESYPYNNHSKGYYSPEGAVVYASNAILIRSLLTTMTASGVQKKKYLYDTLSEIPEYLKEKMRVNLPFFSKMFEMLSSRAELLKHMLSQSDLASKLDNKVDDQNYNNTLPEKTDYLTSRKGKSSSENLEYYNRLLTRLIDCSRTMSKCAEMVYKELQDKPPAFFEMSKDFLADYKARNGKLPIMPFSSFLTPLCSLEGDPDKWNSMHISHLGYPVNEIGSSVYKYNYATRMLLNRNSLEVTIDHFPGAKDIYNMYMATKSGNSITPHGYANTIKYSFTLGKFLLDGMIYGKLYSQDACGFVTVVGQHNSRNMFYAAKWNDYKEADKYYVSDLINLHDVAKTEFNIFKTDNKINTSVFPITSCSIDTIVELSENSDINSSKDKLQALVYNNKHINYTIADNRHNLRIYNILDANIVPLNVHAFMREVPFVNLLNYSYTFDRMIHDFILPTSSDYGKGINMIESKTDVSNTRELLVKLLVHPYTSLNSDNELGYQYFSLTASLFNGNDDMKLGRPRYLSDQLWHKVLLTSSAQLVSNQRNLNDYTKIYSMKALEGGPSAYEAVRSVVNFQNKSSTGEDHNMLPDKVLNTLINSGGNSLPDYKLQNSAGADNKEALNKFDTTGGTPITLNTVFNALKDNDPSKKVDDIDAKEMESHMNILFTTTNISSIPSISYIKDVKKRDIGNNAHINITSLPDKYHKLIKNAIDNMGKIYTKFSTGADSYKSVMNILLDIGTAAPSIWNANNTVDNITTNINTGGAQDKTLTNHLKYELNKKISYNNSSFKIDLSIDIDKFIDEINTTVNFKGDRKELAKAVCVAFYDVLSNNYNTMHKYNRGLAAIYALSGFLQNNIGASSEVVDVVIKKYIDILKPSTLLDHIVKKELLGFYAAHNNTIITNNTVYHTNIKEYIAVSSTGAVSFLSWLYQIRKDLSTMHYTKDPPTTQLVVTGPVATPGLKIWKNNNWTVSPKDPKTRTNPEDVMAVGDVLYCAELGRMRFDTKLVRNQVWFAQLQRIMRVILTSHVSWINSPVVSGLKIMDPSITELEGNATYEKEDYTGEKYSLF